MVDLEDDEDDFLPALARPVFGAASSTTSLPDTDSYGHRANLPSDSSYPAKLGSTTPTRPALTKASASFSANTGHGFGQDARLGKFSNASSSSLATPGTSISSSLALTPGKKNGLASKGSLASFKNAFKSSNTAVPPVPMFDSRSGAPGYPALKNPFSRFDSPVSPKSAGFKMSSKGKTLSPSSPAMARYQSSDGGRKYSITSSHRSQGGRSMTSQGSSNFRADPMPALPPIPTRQTPSRTGRHGSDAGSFMMRRKNGSADLDGLYSAATPAEEALRIVFKEFREVAGSKVHKICARPLVRYLFLSSRPS